MNGTDFSNENPLIPMGALTGRPGRERIHQVLKGYADAGITQYLVYPRSGCELEYLSEEYLERIQMICEEAEKLHFTSIWLYDEFNWPSGRCAGRVTEENPEYSMLYLCAVRKDGRISVEIRQSPTMTDLMNPDAVDSFIAKTHEVYYKRLAPWFGRLIKGIFTDEPEIGFCTKFPDEDALFLMGYYKGMDQDYHALTGGNLLEDVASGLRADPDFHPTVCAHLIAKRFRECFVDRVRAWCDGHGILMTGHLMNETTPFTARKSNGRILQVLDGFSLPGIDEINTSHSLNTFEWLTLGTGMHAIMRRGNGGLAELFALGPCDLSFARMNKMLHLAGAFGIDHYVLAVAAIDARGNSIKNLWYNPYSSDQPHFAAWKDWGEEARRAASLARKPHRYEVAVRYGNVPFLMQDLLRDLTERQISWRLLDIDEPAPEGVQAVLTIEPTGMIRDELSGKMEISFRTLWELILAERIHLDSCVLTPDGDLAGNLFVRRYQDGSVLVVEMSGASRDLLFSRYGGTLRFRLPAHGVRIFPGWQLEYDKPHLQRVHFDSAGEHRLELQTEQELTLALRTYAGEVEVELDGKALSTLPECEALPDGFRSLYSHVSLGLVAAGSHLLRLKGNPPEYPFLPRAIWIGEGLPDYAGTVTQTAKMFIPPDAVKASVEKVPAPGEAELWIGGKCLGRRLQEPYAWMIPDEFRGKEVDVRLVRHTSIGGLFGVCWNGTDDSSRYRQAKFAPHPEPILPLEIDL